MGKRKNNWLHLDLKGAIPSVGKLLEQLEFWKDCGYDGIVWENTDVIISLDMEPGGSMYPNLIGPDGDAEGGQDIRIYYSTDMVDGIRTLSMRKISFK